MCSVDCIMCKQNDSQNLNKFEKQNQPVVQGFALALSQHSVPLAIFPSLFDFVHDLLSQKQNHLHTPSAAV